MIIQANSGGEPLPPEFWRGVEQFNQRSFYECHDTLEALWMEAREPEKRFYQGILQIAVACHHLSNHNWRGAVILLGEGIYRLQGYTSEDYGVDMTKLVQQSTDLLGTLQTAGAEKVADFDYLFNPFNSQADSLEIKRISLPEISLRIRIN
jgi:predicted metal-dependent hydrolase